MIYSMDQYILMNLIEFFSSVISHGVTDKHHLYIRSHNTIIAIISYHDLII